MLAYDIQHLTKIYRKATTLANNDISLTINQGEVFGMLGPNGAGKTTLIRQMAGLARPTSGRIRLFGVDLIQEPQRAGHWVALQPQGFALPYAERPRTLLDITGQLRGMSVSDAHRQAKELLGQFGLEEHANKQFSHLSGGFRRLVSIACSLMGNLPVLILDEPTNDLDPEVRRKVWEIIRNLPKQGTTVVLVTHNVVEAEQALDRVAIIRSGQILAVGTSGELKAKVNQSVRVEVALRPGTSPELVEQALGRQDVHPTGAYRYTLVVHRQEAESALARLMPYLETLDDFRVITPNLEDVYLQLTGGERIEQ